MRLLPSRIVLAALLVSLGAAPLWGQQVSTPVAGAVRLAAPTLAGPASAPTDTPVSRRACAGCPVRRVPWAVTEVILINLLINRLDYYVRAPVSEGGEGGEGGTFDVGPESWAKNFSQGWVWDDNSFSTNQFMHPYHGSTYFNSGRSNGLSFWESATLSALGSFTWEYMFEAMPPAPNDFVATTVGGWALGESLHRLSTVVRDNTARGWSRTWRELAAAPMDPVGLFNRILFGDFSRQMPNPPDRNPVRLGGALEFGTVTLSDTVSGGPAVNTAQPFVRVELLYGDDFLTPFTAPYDVFRANFQIGGGNPDFTGNLSNAIITGRLWGRQLNDANTWRFSIDQHYEFQHNPAYETGGQSFLARFTHRSDIGKGWTLDASAGGVAVLLGAIRAESVQVNERTYDFGPGLGAFAGAALRRGPNVVGRVGYSNYLLETLSGSNGRHLVQTISADAFLPAWRGLGLGASAQAFFRDSRYPDMPNTYQDALQLRAFGFYHF